jgi:hypothetical protein
MKKFLKIASVVAVANLLLFWTAYGRPSLTIRPVSVSIEPVSEETFLRRTV